MNRQPFDEPARRHDFGTARNAKDMGLVVAVMALALACHGRGRVADLGHGPANATTAKEASFVSSEIQDISKNEMPIPDPFSDFRSAVATYFAPVATQFGLRAGVEKTIYPEMYVDFHAPGRRLGIGYELGSGAWVYVVVTTVGGHERQFGLHTVVEQQEGSSRAFNDLRKVHALDAQVRILADLTRTHAGSLLKERSADLRELHLLSEKALRERERTEIGFRGTLEPRPTLSELFQACRPNQHVICAYPAVVDYSYSIEDVAAFLKVSRTDVQRMIDDYDTLQ